MRRGINVRKRKRILLQELNNKSLKLLLLLIGILLFCIIIYFSFIRSIIIQKNFEKDSINFSSLNESIPFSLNKIILFSSATAETDSVNQSLSLDISQYCDIGIYLNNTDKENTFIKSLYINDISIYSPELGTPYLYKKRINDLGKCSFNEKNIINDEFYFNMIDYTSELNYNNYELLNDGSTPISLGFYNKDIKKGFITSDTQVSYNGTLLKNALITQTSLNCNVSFTINIITNKDEHYICNINFDIPFEDEEGSIYDTGYSTKEFKNNELSKFIRIK